jgi:hypothetical protein
MGTNCRQWVALSAVQCNGDDHSTVTSRTHTPATAKRTGAGLASRDAQRRWLLEIIVEVGLAGSGQQGHVSYVGLAESC